MSANPTCALWTPSFPTARDLADTSWTEHRIGADSVEVMFLASGDLDQDGVIDIVTSTRNKKLVFSRQPISPTQRWKAFPIENPHGIPHGKAVAIADINGDRRLDLVHDTNTDGKRHAPGLFWTSYVKSPTDTHWTVHDVSGTEGVKFDLIQVLDLDADGDLDILTCEERDNLAVFWYENPACQATR